MTNRKPRLLYILHAYHNRAGTEVHTQQLARLLVSDFDIYLAYPERGLINLMRPTGVETHLPGEPPIWPVTPYNQSVTENSLAWILDEVAPDLIHIQHFIHWPLSVIDRALVAGKPVALTFHDYYAITPHFTMEGVDSPAQCFTSEYAERLLRPEILQYLLDRRKLLSKSLADVTILLAPSSYTAKIIQEVFDLPISVIEHGIPQFEPVGGKRKKKGVRFGYLGSLLPQKGWEALLSGFSLLQAQRPDTELHVWGGQSEKRFAGVTFHGVYDQKDLSRILKIFDVGVIPSVFRESFSLALSEFWMAGLPVAVSDIGALSERVSLGENGRKFTPGDPRSICEALLWFCDNEEWKEWKIPTPRSEEEMADEYRTLYAALLMRS